MKFVFRTWFIVAALAGLLLSCATDAPAPSVVSRPISNLSVTQVKKLLDQGAPLMLVDTRTDFEFRKGRIPGAVNIPPHKFDVLGSLLPADRGIHLVFYCRGSG